MAKLWGVKVNQWRKEWDEVQWDARQKRAEPKHWFYQFSIPASLLRSWSGVNARATSRRRGQEDLGIQRRHEPKRSAEIRQYVEFGYPWSELSARKRSDPEYRDLRKPGWLPTAIVANVLTSTDERHGRKVDSRDLIRIIDNENGLAELQFPPSFRKEGWDFQGLPPLEIIDGQHRLWAFDPKSDDDFELPVVLFSGLDLSWQAYLFYTINIKPKKINPSLAFDLYPLLRTEDWLTKFEGHIVYRESRAQELVDLLWSYEGSPWHHRINMLGEAGLRGKLVTQAAWVRALLATFVRAYDGPRVRLGGLFGSLVGQHHEVLPWSRLEQAAFLIFLGSKLLSAISDSNEPWAEALRNTPAKPLIKPKDDPAFYGDNSLLSQDQGIRAFLHVANDIFYIACNSLGLEEVLSDSASDEDDLLLVSQAINSFNKKRKLVTFSASFSRLLAEYDWRSASAPGLEDSERVRKAGFRGSGGYKELRTHLLKHLASYEGEVGEAAEAAIDRLGY